jgi:RNA-splicing ligase RtcB
MIIIKGKYNIAKVMLPDDSYLDNETRSQIYSFLNHPAFSGKPIVIMPDCHQGKGSVIGFTMHMNNTVIPNVIGVDINCGVLTAKIPKNFKFDELDGFIRENIPSGHNIRTKVSKHLATYHDDLISVVEDVAKKIDQTVSAILSLGTLGGGNHFIEVGEDDTDEHNYYLSIHTGSRNFGLKVCEYHQNKAKALMNDMFIGDAYRYQEFLPLDHGGYAYIKDMKVAQQYAELNRHIILKTIMVDFFKISNWFFNKHIECAHNYINFNDSVIRKGAISAHAGEKVIIPLNMRDGIIVGVGKGNKDWNYSAPHGAGRILSRKKAKESISLEEFQNSMHGVWSSSVNTGTVDEAPQAYKDADLIKNMIQDTVDIKMMLRPVYNFKAS